MKKYNFSVFPVTCTHNVYVSHQIADFGFAATERSSMGCQSIVGSKTYMAPEVLNVKVREYNGYLVRALNLDTTFPAFYAVASSLFLLSV